MPSSSSSTSCWLSLFSESSTLVPTGSNRFGCTTFTLPSPSTGTILKPGCQHMADLQPYKCSSLLPMVPYFMFSFKGHSFKEPTHLLAVGYSHSMIIVSLMLLVFFPYNLFAMYVLAMSLWYRLKWFKLLLHLKSSYNIDFSLCFCMFHYYSTNRDLSLIF